MQLNDILQAGQHLQNIDLVAQQCLVDFALNVLHIDQLQSDRLACVEQLIPLESLAPLYTTLE